MDKKEILYISCVLALLAGAYFFAHRLLFPSPEHFPVYGQPKIDRVKQQMDYMEKNSAAINEQGKREQLKYEREFKKAEPLLKVEMEYFKSIDEQIAKLPPDKRNNQKEIMKIIAKERRIYSRKKLPGQKYPFPKTNSPIY